MPGRPKASASTGVLVVLVLLSACSPPPPSGPPPPKVRVAQPVAREVTEWDEYTARMEAIESVEVRARVSGYLQVILFREGAMVRKGDLLLLIDSRPYEAVLRRAEADLSMANSRLALARKNLARAADLLRSSAISQEDADIRESAVKQAESAVEQAQADVDSAKLDVEFTEVVAPISGRIGRRLVTEGNLINGGVGSESTLLATIVSLDPMYAYFDADERSYLKYMQLARTGERPTAREFHHPVWLGIGDEEGFPRQGRMDFVDNQFDSSTGTMVGRAVVPNPDGSLTPGLFARLRLAGSGKLQALLVPDEAVASDQSQKFVYVVDGENRAQYRTVKTGSLIDGLRLVREGLTAGDWVITSGVQRARPGLLVDPERVAAAQPRAAPAQPRAAPAQPRAAPDGGGPAPEGQPAGKPGE